MKLNDVLDIYHNAAISIKIKYLRTLI